MRLIAKDIRMSHAKFHCDRLTTVQYIQDYASLLIEDTVYNNPLGKVFNWKD